MNDKNLIPPFNRQGNKYNIKDKILILIPKSHSIYVELFLGSGAIFFNKEKAEINILNDLDKSLVDSLKLIKKTPISNFPKLDSLNDFKTFFTTSSLKKTQDKILYYKIKNQSGYRSRPIKNEKGITHIFNIKKWLLNLSKWQSKLTNTIITNKDYEVLVKKYDTPTTFFFIDPPYENTHVDFGYAESKLFDFDRLARVLKKIKGKFLLTINDSDNIRFLFKDFTIIENLVRNNWINKETENKSKFRKELIIKNY
tara:strand:- start:25 stop:789 length:765 start_codon:yes stop_codon:yes gene_type:complete